VPDSNYKIVEECLHDLCNFVLDLHIFKRILLADAAKNVLFARLLQLAREKDFVENVVCFGKGEDNIKLAHIAIVFIHLFDVSVNNFEGDQLVIVGGAAGDEKERGISAVDDLSICSEVSMSSLKQITKGAEGSRPLYSRKLHMRVLRASTS
jgi:hypothetical protein